MRSDQALVLLMLDKNKLLAAIASTLAHNTGDKDLISLVAEVVDEVNETNFNRLIGSKEVKRMVF